MKKIFSIITVLCLVVNVIACGFVVASAEGTLKTTVLLDAESDVSVYGAVRQKEKNVRSGNYSFYSAYKENDNLYNEWGLRANKEMFDVDLTDYKEKGALVFWVYIDGDASTVSANFRVILQSNTGGFVMDDWLMYNAGGQITKSNAWNRVVAPFSSFYDVDNSKNGVQDWSSIKRVSIRTYSPLMSVDMYLDDFIAVSDFSAWQIANETIKTKTLLDGETNVNNLGNALNIYGATRQANKVKQGSYSFYSEYKPNGGEYNQWGLKAQNQMFDVDLTDYKEKGALVFWVYVDGSLSGVGKNFRVILQSNTGGFVMDDWLMYNAGGQITKSNAWNRVVIPFSSFYDVDSKKDGPQDWSSIKRVSLRIYDPLLSVDLYFDDFVAVSDYNLYLETHPECGYMMLDDCEDTAQKSVTGAVVSVKNTKNGKYSYHSSPAYDDIWIYRSVNRELGANITSYLERGAFAFWMYVDGDPAKLGTSIRCWLTSDKTASTFYSSGLLNGYRWSINTKGLKQGWNAIILPFSDATTSNDTATADDLTNPTEINQFSLHTMQKKGVDVWTDCYMVIDNYADGMPNINGELSSRYVAEIPVSGKLTPNSNKQILLAKSFDPIDLTSHKFDNLQLVIDAEISGDVAAFKSAAKWLELTSSGTSDQREISFNMGQMPWKLGHNSIRVNLNDGNITNRLPDFNKLNYLRLFTNQIASDVTVDIKSIRIEDASYVIDSIPATASGYITDENPKISASTSFGIENISDNAALSAEVYLNAEAVPENIIANFALSSVGSVESNYISAQISDFDWKIGKNVINVPVSSFNTTGTVSLTNINFASLSFTASGIDGETELYLASASLVDGDKLAANSTNSKFSNYGIDVDTSVLFVELDFANVESGTVKLLSDGGCAYHRFNSKLVIDGSLILPIGDFVAEKDFDFNSVNCIEVIDSTGAEIKFDEFYILNDCNDAVAKKSYMPTLFTDNMMFRQNETIKVWGFSSPLSDATATLYKGDELIETVNVISDTNGKYELNFSAREGSYDTYSVVVTDSKHNTYNINNILIGEIWLAGGQSNMEYSIGGDIDVNTLLSKEYLNSDINKAIRVYLEPKLPNAEDLHYQPMGGVTDIPGAYWAPATTDAIRGMSSLAYTFARELRAELDVPVGIINTPVGGTVIESWISREYFYSGIDDKTGIYYYDEHRVAVDINRAGALYHQKIEALEGFGISGVIWYQGESNSKNSYRYAELLNLLKSTWSEVFGFENNSMPFIFTQVAPDVYDWFETSNKIQHTAYLSEQMEKAYKSNIANNMAMISIYDLPLDYTTTGTIHPGIKTPIGKRFALSAMNLVYGGSGENSSPVYLSKEIVDEAIYIKFDNVGESLKSISGDALRGFAICGADNVYAGAYAEIVAKDTVKVWNPLISEPCDVTYAFETMNQSSNLANSDGIPASPFRTKIYDDRVGVPDDSVTYYNTQEWMFADKDYWQNIKRNSAAVSELWSVSDGATVEYSSEHFIDGEASIKVNVPTESTVMLTPKVNVYGGKDIELSKYSLISVDVYAENDISLTLNATDSNGNTVSLLPVNYEKSAVGISGTNSYNTIIFKIDNSVSLSGINFEISTQTNTAVYFDNIIIGTDDESKTVVKGDVNCDKQVNILDFISAEKYLANEANRISYNSFDCDLSSKIDIKDLIFVKKILLGVYK